MATLGSPGVQVQVIDESFYTPAAPGTVPMIFVASAQDKSNASATGTAQGTTAANAGKVWVITSQRDLTDTFGTPLFYTDVSGNPIHGSEVNEYGLQAAYSLLGASSRAYVVRADLNLADLVPTTSIPTGNPAANTYWVDTSKTLFGVNVWNSTTSVFSTVTPLIIDSSNVAINAEDDLTPKTNFGNIGDFAIVVTPDNMNQLWYKDTSNQWQAVLSGFDGGKFVEIKPHTQYPDFSGQISGSVWIKTTSAGHGANWAVKYFNGSTKSWTSIAAPLYDSVQLATRTIDPSGGGINIPVGSVFVETNPEHQVNKNAEFTIWKRKTSGVTAATKQVATTVSSIDSKFILSKLGSATTVTVVQSALPLAQQIPAAIAAAGLDQIAANYDVDSHTLTIYDKNGGDFEILDSDNSPLTTIGFLTTATTNLYPAVNGDYPFTFLATNWTPLSYAAKPTAPTSTPIDGKLWYDSALGEVDIMIHNGTTWVGYKSTSSPYFTNGTDISGPIVSALEPMTQLNGSALATGDIWVSTADTDRYGKDIYVYNLSSGKWVLQDVTDQVTPDGWVFADARWATSGSTEVQSTIKSLLASDYLDPDAPDPALYPRGTKLWNTRRSGNNVKKYIANYLNLDDNSGKNIRFSNEDMASYVTARWVGQETRNEDGSGRFGRFAQRGVVTAAFKKLIDVNTAVRDTDTLVFNLMATPGYPEAIQNMITLNADRGYTAFVVGDTPFRLPANGTALTNWGNNTALAFDNGEDGAVSFDPYGCMAMFYPSGYTTDNTGNNIVVPPSHMMLRTISNSDAKSYQWFAPAGTRRGGVDNATSVGYIDAVSHEFKTAALHESLRTVLQSVKINPIATLPGVGIVNFGQMTRYNASSSLDRINVARLVAYLRRQLAILAKPYLFEPNDAQTRREIKAAADSLLLELVGQRALYDFVTVCDTTNNTAARIDRSELWLDIAIEPVKAVEFIYIPLRIKKTGSIASGV